MLATPPTAAAVVTSPRVILDAPKVTISQTATWLWRAVLPDVFRKSGAFPRISRVTRVDRRNAAKGAERLVRTAMVSLLALAEGCTTDHDQLAKQPGQGANSSTSAATSSGMGGASSTGSGHAVTTTGNVGPNQYPADGDDVLTLVHGQVDAERIAFCFAELREGETRLVSGNPTPERGLTYGGHLALRAPGGLDFNDDSIVPIVLAGDLAAVADMDCEEALASAYWVGRAALPESDQAGAGGAGGAAGAAGGPGTAARPPLRAMELPALPAGTLILGKNYVMVVHGCMGGPGVEDGNGVHCGHDFSPSRANLRPLLVPVSREIRIGQLALQFMHASLASSQIDIRSRPVDAMEQATLLASSLKYGFVPSNPRTDFSVEQLGILEGASLEVLILGQREFESTWEDAAALGGAESVENGESYLIVLLGPALGTQSDEGFNPTRVSVIPTGVGRSE